MPIAMLTIIAAAASAKNHQCGWRSNATVSSGFSCFFGYGMRATLRDANFERAETLARRSVGAMDVEALLAGLDAEQREAVIVQAAPLAIVAAAGSGKTTVLTRRIAHRVLTDPTMTAQHALVLTFTTQAARELQLRLRRAGIRDRIEAGTFHAIALRLLRQRAIDAGQRPPSVVTDRARLVQEALPSSRHRREAQLLLTELDWARARRIRLGDYAVAARQAGRRSPVDAADLIAVAEGYALVKRRRGVLDFDDLLEQCLLALHTDKLWAAGVRWRYRHLFVDEAQDINPLQHALLEAIRDDRPDICLVGDPRQAIFGFNGADPAIMQHVDHRYPGVTLVRLRRNYRCSPQIIAAARAVLEHSGQDDDSVSAANAAEPARVVSFADADAENDGVAHLARELVGVHRPWRTCAVLARTTAQLNAVGKALAALGIPVNTQGSSSNRALAAALGEAYTHRSTPALVEWVEQVSADDSAEPIRTRVAEAADRYLAQGVGMTFRAWVELHSPFDDIEEEETDDGVELLTFHGAKGREWPTVIIIGAERGLVPHVSAVTPAQRDEEARLLYVACTRARETLVLSWAASRNGRRAQPSPLIAGIADAGGDAVAPPPNPRPPRLRPDPVYAALVEWRRNAAKAANVDPATICSDDGLRAVAQARPSTVEAVVALTDLGPIAAARIAPRMLAVLSQAQ
jgi:DNA helicase II / ATP-dependent DNA helicase PcrA